MDTSTIQLFIKEKCTPIACKQPAGMLYNAYRLYCLGNNLFPLRPADFYHGMVGLGYTHKKATNGAYYTDVRLTDDTLYDTQEYRLRLPRELTEKAIKHFANGKLTLEQALINHMHFSLDEGYTLSTPPMYKIPEVVQEPPPEVGLASLVNFQFKEDE